MTQKKSIEKRFKSLSTGQDCDCAQYVAEVMCYRKAAKDQVPGLEYKFWNKSRKAEFQAQIVSARRLITTFGEDALLYYINNEGKNLYSLGRFNSPKFVIEGLTRAFNRVKYISSQRAVTEYKEPQHPTNTKKRKNNGLFSKIRKAEQNNG